MSFDVAAFQEMYRSQFANDFVTIDLKVSTGQDAFDTHSGLRAWMMSYRPEDLVAGGSIEQNDTKCIILAEDLPAGLRPLERKDRVVTVSDGKVYSVMRWDTKTRSIGNTVLAVEAQLRG